MGAALTPGQSETYARDGYLVVPGLYEAALCDRVRRLAWRTAMRFVPSLQGDTADAPTPWDSPAFEQAVCRLYADEPEAFEAFYDMLQNAALLRELAGNPTTLGIVAALTGEEPDGLALSGVQLRVDVPRDPKNVHAWHQERAYYVQNVDGQRGLVMSVAIQDTPADAGALRVCPGSHLDGLHAHDGPEFEGAAQKNLSPKLVERFEPTAVELDRGDTLFMHMNTFHQPGRNLVERVRYTFICRYHQMVSDPTYIAARARLDANPRLLREAEAEHGPVL